MPAESLSASDKEGDFIMFVRLSHIMERDMPGWPGSPTCYKAEIQTIREGAVSNVYLLTVMNHFGTHFDAPNHYNDPAPKISELPLEYFVYDRPLLIDIKKSYEEFITPAELEPFYGQIKKADFLMIHSGFSHNRLDDPVNYAGHGPAIGAEACKYIMDNFNIKAVAMDWISLASVPYKDDGTLAHQYLLGCYHDHYTCIIEDCTFEGIVGKKIKRVYALPLLMGMGVDSGPVTVIAECEE